MDKRKTTGRTSLLIIVIAAVVVVVLFLLRVDDCCLFTRGAARVATICSVLQLRLLHLHHVLVVAGYLVADGRGGL